MYDVCIRFHEFLEWGQCLLLEILLRYSPENDEEMFDIMVNQNCEPFRQSFVV